MKLQELETGMAVKLRNGAMYRVMLNTLHGDVLVGKSNCIYINDIEDKKGYYNNDDLLYNIFGSAITLSHQYDIMKVYEAKNNDLGGLLSFKLDTLNLIYSRMV